MDDRTIMPDRDDDDDFDWCDSDIVIYEQPTTAVYINISGGVVIRQRPTYQHDQIVVIAPQLMPVLIASLQSAAAEAKEYARWAAEHPEEAAAERRPKRRIVAPPIAPLSTASTLAPGRPSPDPDDEWRAPIADYLAGASRTTIADVADGALRIEEPGTSAQRRIIAILVGLGWTQHRDKRGRWWERGDSTSASLLSLADADGVTNPASAVTTACANPSPAKRST